MKFVILCPHGVRTGGPEACYQLSDSMISNGFEAEIWLLSKVNIEILRKSCESNADLSKININVEESKNQIDEYRNYRMTPFRHLAEGESVVFIIPEVYLSLLPLFRNCKVVIWWLSVDNAFGALSQINLNLLRMPNMHHAVQSTYAKEFAAALGLETFDLSDYTRLDSFDSQAESNLTNRPFKIALNAGKKVIFDLDHLINLIKEQYPQAVAVKIAGMTRDQVNYEFSTSRVFIDIGNFPGKDRMAREALVRGTNVIVGASGSGHYYEDYPIPSVYRPKSHDLLSISQLAVHMLLNPKSHYNQFDTARSNVFNEKALFDQEVVLAFSRFL